MSEIKKISLEELYPIIKEKLEQGGTVEIPVTGTSMLPLLVQGRDSVIISSANEVKINDIIFYRRDDGHFVLHRVVGTNDKGYILCGDNQWVKEYGITDNNIIGVVVELKVDGKVFSTDDEKYRKYCNRQLKNLPYRKPIVLLQSKIRAIKRKVSSR